MESVGEILGDAVTAEVAGAWSEALMALANLLISLEGKLYKEAEEKQWTGPRDFVITDIIEETADIKSFRMVPSDNKKTICPFQPGQYISVFEKPEGKKYFSPRHYTVTSQPSDEFYQITVKKLRDYTNPNDPSLDGIMSNYLHTLKINDTIKLGPVFGPPIMDKGDKSRVAAFVSVGVGITPTVSVLPQALKDRPQVAVFHGDSNSASHAFRDQLTKLANGNNDDDSKKKLILSTSYATPQEEDKLLPDYSEGRLDGQKIVESLRANDINYQAGTDYYICAGPKVSFTLVKELEALGVKKENMHLEFFGPFMSTI